MPSPDKGLRLVSLSEGATYPESFADYPVSVAETRAEKIGPAAPLPPRSALIQVLREIDNKTLDPDTIVILYREKKYDGSFLCGYHASGADSYTTMGILQKVLSYMASLDE